MSTIGWPVATARSWTAACCQLAVENTDVEVKLLLPKLEGLKFGNPSTPEVAVDVESDSGPLGD